MAKINIKECLNTMDKNTDCQYDLVNLYGCCILTERDKQCLAKALHENVDALEVYKNLQKKFNDKNSVFCFGLQDSNAFNHNVQVGDTSALGENINESKYFVGGQEVPYTNHKDARNAFKKKDIKEYADGLRKYLDEQKFHYHDFYADRTNYGYGDPCIKIFVERGDWKHDHLRLDYLVEKYFEKFGIIVEKETNVTQEDGSDTYSAEHIYSIEDVIFEIRQDSEDEVSESFTDADRVIKKYNSSPYNGYVPVAEVKDYIQELFDGDLDDKYGCMNSIINDYKNEGKVATETIEQYAGAHNLVDKNKSAEITERLGTDLDAPYSKKEVQQEITSITDKFQKPAGTVKSYYKQEADIAEQLLKRYYDTVKVYRRGNVFEIQFSGRKQNKNVPRRTSNVAERKIMFGKSAKKLDEANYGGAYDIDPEQYFTKDDVMEFAYGVVDNLNEIFYTRFDIYDVDIQSPNDLYLAVQDSEGNIIEHTKHIDMRKIKKPSDLRNYYSLYFAGVLRQKYEEFEKELTDNLTEGIWDDVKAAGKTAIKNVGNKLKQMRVIDAPNSSKTTNAKMTNDQNNSNNNTNSTTAQNNSTQNNNSTNNNQASNTQTNNNQQNNQNNSQDDSENNTSVKQAYQNSRAKTANGKAIIANIKTVSSQDQVHNVIATMQDLKNSDSMHDTEYKKAMTDLGAKVGEMVLTGNWDDNKYQQFLSDRQSNQNNNQ